MLNLSARKNTGITAWFSFYSDHELFRTLPEKAAALFHSLIATHPFDNGKERTAVIALDLFLTANGQFLCLCNDCMYRLAVDTASYVPRGITHEEMLARIAAEIRESTLPITKMAASEGTFGSTPITAQFKGNSPEDNVQPRHCRGMWGRSI